MRILLLCKRRYTNRDLIDDRFGRLFHLPRQWAQRCPVQVVSIDYLGRPATRIESPPPAMISLPCGIRSPWRSLRSFRAMVQEAERFRPTVIVASSDVLYGLIGRRLATRLGAGFAFDIYDDYRTFAVNRYSGLGRLFSEVCTAADLLLCASHPIAKMVERYGPPTLVVSNGYDPETFKVGRDAKLRQKLGIGDQEILLVYPGSPVRHFDTELVISALERLNASGARTRLLLIGDKSERVAARSLHVIAHPAVDQVQVASLLQAADIGIAPYVETPQTRVSAPCKLAEYLATGLQVVSADVSDVYRYRRNGVLTYRPGSVDDFVAAVRNAQSEPQRVSPIHEASWEQIAGSAYEKIEACCV